MRKSEMVLSLREKMENQQKGALHMSHTKRHALLSLVVIVAVLLERVPAGNAAAGSCTTSRCSPRTTHATRDAPTYGMRGPYAVGTREVLSSQPKRGIARSGLISGTRRSILTLRKSPPPT